MGNNRKNGALKKKIFVFLTAILMAFVMVFAAACDLFPTVPPADPPSTQDPTDDPNKDPNKDPNEDPNDDPNKDPEDDPNKDPNEDPNEDDPTDDPNKDPNEDDPSGDEEASELEIHFLELGGSSIGDCVLIKSGNTEVLIDAGAKSNSAPTKEMRDYVAQYCTDGILEYVIATHAHEDHIAGLVGNADDSTSTGFLYQYQIGTIIQYAQKKTTSNISARFTKAVEYCKGLGTKVYTALECTQETNGASATYYLDEAQNISMKILYQQYYEKSTSSENNYSVCMLLTHKTENSVYNALFTGDLEESGEKSLVENNPDLPHCDLYKGGHHGSSTSSNDILLDKITPDNIAICTCAGTYEYADKPTAENPNAYLNTFPTQEAINRMAKHTKNIYVTTLGIIAGAENNYKTLGYESMNGNIVFYYDNKEKEFKLRCSNNTTILKETEWFKANRTWPSYGVV